MKGLRLETVMQAFFYRLTPLKVLLRKLFVCYAVGYIVTHQFTGCIVRHNASALNALRPAMTVINITARCKHTE